MDKQRINILLAEHLCGWTKQERQVAGETVPVWIDPDAKGMEKKEYQEHELPDLAGTWTGMGIITTRMNALHYRLKALQYTDGFYVAWTRDSIDSCDYQRTQEDDLPTGAGLAALRTLGKYEEVE